MVIFVASLLYAPVLALLRNVYAYVNFEEDDEALGGGGGGGGVPASETKPLAAPATTDYRSYMMSAIKPGNGSAATAHDEPPAYNSVGDGYGGGAQQAVDDVNRK